MSVIEISKLKRKKEKVFLGNCVFGKSIFTFTKWRK